MEKDNPYSSGDSTGDLKEKILDILYDKKKLAMFAGAIIAVIAFVLILGLIYSPIQNFELSISDSSGNPLEGVLVLYSSGDKTGRIETDSDGKAAIPSLRGKELSIEIQEQKIGDFEYSYLSRVFSAEETSSEIILKKTSEATNGTRLTFAGPSGTIITGKKISIRLFCANGFTPKPETIANNEMNGKITVEKPKDCDYLSGQLTGPPEFAKTTFSIEGASKTITLQQFSSNLPQGKITIMITDEDNNPIKDTSFVVQLINSNDRVQSQKMTGTSSRAVFEEISPGTYSLGVSDRQGNYAQETQSVTVTAASPEQEKTIAMTRNIRGTITVSAIDKETLDAIDGAAVMLFDSEGNLVEQQLTTTENNEITFSIKESGSFKIEALKEGYLPFEKTTNINSRITAELEKASEENSAEITVKVTGEDSLPVENASVYLKNAEDETMPYEIKSTDAEGTAVFAGVTEGTYYASAEKQGAAGNNKESAKKIEAGDKTEFNVTITAGNSAISITTLDSSEQPVESEIQLFDETGTLLQSGTTSEGKLALSEKAFKSVYATAKSSGYDTITTIPKTLWPNEATEFRITMLKTATESPATATGEPTLEFLGIFKNNAETSTINLGEKYTARFRIAMPAENRFLKAGFHFRIGEEGSVENENAEITNVLFPNPLRIIKGTTYSPPLGFQADITSDNGKGAKWANTEFVPSLSQYYFETEFKVKENSKPNSLIPLNYRAWFVDSQGNYTRIPEDTALGTKKDTEQKNGLYAQANTLNYYEGFDSECSERICYGSEWIFDKEKQQVQKDNFLLRMNSNYSLNFAIRNNSEQTGKLELNIEPLDETEVLFNDVTIANREEKNITIGAGSIKSLDIGTMAKDEIKKFSISFKPKKGTFSYLQLAIKENSKEISSKTINFSIQNGKEIILSINPEKIIPLTETKLAVKAEYNSKPLKDAQIIITRKLADNSQTTLTGITGEDGTAKITIPSTTPGATLILEAQKEGHYSEQLETKIDGEVFTTSNDELETELDGTFKGEKTIETEITNNTGTNLQISSAEISGDLKGLIDEAAMQAYLKSLIGTAINANNTAKIGILRIKVPSGTRVQNNETIDAVLTLRLKDPKTGVEFSKEIKTRITISATQAAQQNCIKISKTEWKGYTKNNLAMIDIEIQNNCSIAGTTTGLSRLIAKTEWNGTALGITSLQRTDTIEEQSSALGENKWQAIMSDLSSGEKISARIFFAPKDGTLGQTAKFKIMLDGEIETEEGNAKVGTTSINSEIEIVNKDQCLKIPQEKIEITGSSGQITIDASQCKTSMEIALCRNDSGCKGGATEGDLSLSQKAFTLTPQSPSATITVSKGAIAGIYGIKIEARTKNSPWETIKTIDATIQPEQGAIFPIDKYEFSLIGTGTKDSATVTNPNLATDVEVIAPVTAWQASVNSGNSYFDPDVAGTGRTPEGLKNAKPAAELAKQKIAEMAQKAYAEADKARQMQEEAKKKAEDAAQKGKDSAGKAGDAAGQAGQGAQLADLLAGPDFKAAVECCQPYCNAVAIITPISIKCCTAFGVLIGSQVAVQATKQLAQAAKGSADQGKQQAQQGQNNADQGKQNNDNGTDNQTDGAKGPCATTDPSGRAKEGSQQSMQAAQDAVKAAMKQAQCAQNQDDAGKSANQAGMSAASAGAEVGTVLSTGLAAAALCKPCAAPIKAYTAKATAIKAIEGGVQTAADAAQKAAEGAKQACDDAKKASDEADKQSQIAEDQLNKLSIVELNAEEAAKYGKGRTVGILGSYAGLGTLIGAYAGNAYNISTENCSKGFSSILPAFVTNLKEDKGDILVDNAGITGAWNVDEAKVSGEYESQTAGIYFENTSLEAGEPVYSIVRITATKRNYSEPVSAGGTYAGAGTTGSGSGFGPFNVPTSSKATVEQKYHLKFITAPKTKQEAANSSAGNICLQEAKIGSTGTNALPKVKLDWSWHDDYGISEKTCLEENTDSVYCDATQFSIMLSKRIKTIQEFVEKNNSINCPKNPSIEILKWIVQKWNPYLTEIGETAMPTNLENTNPECWLPKTTNTYDSKPAINYYLEESPGISWTSKIKNTTDLTKYLQFNAYLIKDGYSPEFQRDFATYYNNQVLLNAPEWFTRSPSGKISDYFLNQNRLQFTQKFLSQSELPNPGLYNIFLNIDFGDQWRFYNDSRTPNAVIKTEMNFKKEPEKGSIFYYLPFNANMGTGSGENKSGYGTGYVNENNPFQISGASIDVTTNSTGTGGLSTLYTKTISDIAVLNTSFEKRGLLLDINGNQSEKRLSFYPSYATPAIMSFESNEDGNISAYFQLRESKEPVKPAENLSFWTGMQNCTSLDGKTQIKNIFNSTPDRYAGELDTQTGKALAYALDWDNALAGKTTLLKTIIYSPTTKTYALGNYQTGSMNFRTPDTAMQSSIDLEGISGMAYNSKASDNKVYDLKSLFDAIKQGNACITNNPGNTQIWWNEKTLEKTKGKQASISDTEKSPNCG